MAWDENGNWVDDPPPDQQDPGAPDPGADSTSQGAPEPSGSSIDPGVDPSAGTAPPGFGGDPGAPTNWSQGGTWQPGQPTSTDPTGSIGMGGGGDPGPAPGSPGGAQAPTPGPAPTPGSTSSNAGGQGFKFPDYSGAFQRQMEMNDAWNKRLFEFEQQKYNQDYALRNSQFEESKKEFQQDFDLRSAAQKADQAYKEALIQTGNVQLAQQAMRDSMTRDFQNQELAFRNQQMAQTTDIEREKLDIQRRLLPVTRTARRAATVATF